MPLRRRSRLGAQPASGPRLAGIEGLRALAAGSIVLVHVWGDSTPGGVVLGAGGWIADLLSSLSAGVTLFFTLSGFLLYRPFAAAIARGTPYLRVRSYLRNRFLRIAPAYWVILLTTALVLGTADVRLASGGLGPGHITDPTALLQAALLVHDYRPTTILIGIGPAWSLAVEVVFYVALPVLVVAAARVARPMPDRGRRILVLCGPPLLLLLVGLSGKAVAAYVLPAAPVAGYGANWHSVVERSFWAQADLFSFGMLVAVVHVEVADGRLGLPRHWRVAATVLAVLIFVPSAATMHHAEHSYLLQNTGEALALALAFAAIVIPLPPGAAPLRAMRVLESRALVAMGLASYSLFLWHLPVTTWLRDHGLTAAGWGGLVLNLVIVAVTAGGLSYVTYRFVEVPALRRKRSPTAGRPEARESSPAPAPPAPAANPATEPSRS